jgi:hypothetical protein
MFSARLDAHISLAHDLTLECGAVGNRYGHLTDLNLDAANLNALLDQLSGFFFLSLSLDFVPRHGDDMLVLCNTCG